MFDKIENGKIVNINFVCSGNTCRSYIAEAVSTHLLRTVYFKKNPPIKDKINIGSAGASVILSELPLNSCRVLDTIEVPNIKFAPTQLDESIIVSSDIIITMTTSHKNCIFRDYGNFNEKKIFNLIELSNIILYFQSEKIYSRTPCRRARANELSKSKVISIIFSKISKLKEINREELITARNLDIEDPFGKPFSTYLRVAGKIKENISIIFDYLFGV